MTISRREIMYAIVAAQLLVLAAIVAPQELNRALDRGPAVDVEISHARASKNPFRGALVSGESSLELEARAIVLPEEGLRPGDHVLVGFTIEPERRPRIVSVVRGRRAPAFTETGFTIPGRVVGGGDFRVFGRREGGLLAHVGTPAITIALDVPRSVAVDDAALTRLSGPSLVRASLHAGFLGKPYFTDVRLAGRGWGPDVRLAYDHTRQRLVVVSPREMALGVGATKPAPKTDLLVFDVSGKELGATEVDGRIVDAVVEPDGKVLALVSDQPYGQSEVSLMRLSDNAQVVQRSAPMPFDRVLGFDAATGSIWVVAGAASGRPQPPHFIQRMTLGGLQEPRLGPFDSIPRAVRTVGDDAWVVETSRHRVTHVETTTGRIVREYRDLNNPVDVAVDASSIYVIEANRTQLTRIGSDGRVLWRVPRFTGLAWAITDPATGGGWAGAATFDGAVAGVLRFTPDGMLTRVAATVKPMARDDWRRRVGLDVARASEDGRLVFLEYDAIVIMSPDGSTVSRVVGFRFPTEQRLRS